MRIKTTLLLCFLFVSLRAMAQDSLQIINQNRNHIKLTGMEVLGSWGIAEITAGTIFASNTNGQEHYFHQMNAIWNVANLGIAAAGFINARKTLSEKLSPSQSLIEQRKLEHIFLINGGFDFVYIGTGFFLKNRGDDNGSEQLKGYGNSVMFQGGFLLLFDATMYTLVKNNGSKLRLFLNKTKLSFTGNKIGLMVEL